jgi:hypothetical protein
VLRLSELKLPLDHSDADLSAAICRRLRLKPDQLRGHRLVKRSVDARRNGSVHLLPAHHHHTRGPLHRNRQRKNRIHPESTF